MWTKIQSTKDIDKMKLNARLLKFAGAGIPKDPPPDDPAYFLYSFQKNTGGNLDLKATGHNPLFSSLTQPATGLLQKTVSQIIAEGSWWY